MRRSNNDVFVPKRHLPIWIQIVSLQEPEEISELPLHESLSSFREMLSTGRVCVWGEAELGALVLG